MEATKPFVHCGGLDGMETCPEIMDAELGELHLEKEVISCRIRRRMEHLKKELSVPGHMFDGKPDDGSTIPSKDPQDG